MLDEVEISKREHHIDVRIDEQCLHDKISCVLMVYGGVKNTCGNGQFCIDIRPYFTLKTIYCAVVRLVCNVHLYSVVLSNGQKILFSYRVDIIIDAVAKQYGFWMVKEYRDAYGMFAVNGILFNHESERRGENFVTRKITLAAGRIAEGLQDHLELGNMDSLRDWGYAKDYVECMWLIMQQDKPEDFVIATGVQHTVRDFTEKAFAANGITIRWEGTGIDEKGYDAATGKMLVCVNPQWFRPTDVDNLWGDPTKAKTVLGWNPQSTTYEQLVEIMAKHDRERAKREKALKAVL